MSVHKRTARSLIVLACAVMTLGVAAPAADAVKLANVTGGQSGLTVNMDYVRALGQENIFSLTLPPASLSPTLPPVATFPINGGLVETDTLIGTVNHAGGIRIVKYNAEFTVVEKQLDTTELKILNGNTLTGNALGLIPTPTADLVNVQHSTDASGVIHYEADVKLTAGTALVLNVYFETQAFTAGMLLGHINTTAETSRLLL